MGELQEKELRAVLDFLRTADLTRDLESFRADVTTGLARLIPCDVCTYNEIDARRGQVLWVTEPAEAAADADPDAFFRHIAEHPIIEHHRRTGDGRPRTFSDFVTSRAFHHTGLYSEFFRPLGLETQLGAPFHGPASVLVGMAMNGERRDFSRRDRLVMDLLRPHLSKAYETALARTRSERMLRSLQAAASAAGAAVVLLSADGRIEVATGNALARLHAHFGAAVRGDALPGPVGAWAQGQRLRLGSVPAELPDPASVLTHERDGAVLRIRFLARRSPAEPDALLLEERRPGPSAEELRALGLTRRETEVLALLAADHSNDEIARALVISPRTVEKHVEHIYAKLGVTSRAAAVTRAHRAAGVWV